MVHIIWTTPGNETSEWESTWLLKLFGDSVDSHIHDPNMELPPKSQSVIIVNPKSSEKNVATSLYLKQYEDAGVPFGLIHLSDEFLNCDYRMYNFAQCRFVYRNYWHPMLCQGKVRCFPMGYKIGFESPAPIHIRRILERTYTWCFSGNLKFRHPERLRGLQVFHALPSGKCVIEHGDSFSNPTTGLNTLEYQTMLSNSIFALCPPGNIHLDSFRMYEALEAGAIPVTLAFTQQQPYSPSYWTYVFAQSDAIPFVAEESWEKCMEKVTYLLQHKEELEQVQTKCIEFWNKCKHQFQVNFKQSFDSLLAMTNEKKSTILQ